MREPGPNRVECRLDEKEERGFERRDPAQAPRDEGIGDPDLHDAEEDDVYPVPGSARTHGESNRETDEEGEQVSDQGRAEPGLLVRSRARAQPAHSHQRESPSDPARRGDEVSAGGVRRRHGGGFLPEEEHRQARSHGGQEREVPEGDPLPEQPGREQQDVEGRRRLEEDRVRRGCEFGRGDEEDQRPSVGERHKGGFPGPTPSRRRNEEGDRHRSHGGAEARDLPVRKPTGLDGGSTGGKEGGGHEDLKSGAAFGVHGPRTCQKDSGFSRLSSAFLAVGQAVLRNLELFGFPSGNA